MWKYTQTKGKFKRGTLTRRAQPVQITSWTPIQIQMAHFALFPAAKCYGNARNWPQLAYHSIRLKYWIFTTWKDDHRTRLNKSDQKYHKVMCCMIDGMYDFLNNLIIILVHIVSKSTSWRKRHIYPYTLFCSDGKAFQGYTTTEEDIHGKYIH